MASDNIVMQESIGKLNEMSEKLTGVNGRLMKGISYIINSFVNLNKTFETSFTSIKELENKISLYRLE